MIPARFVSLLLLVVGGACATSNDVVYRADQVVVYDADAVLSPTTLPVVPAVPVLIERIWSPEEATAEVLGVGAVPGDMVTVNDGPAEVLSFDVGAEGSFTVRVRILEAGAHTVCVRDECGRVFVVAPDTTD